MLTSQTTDLSQASINAQEQSIAPTNLLPCEYFLSLASAGNLEEMVRICNSGIISPIIVDKYSFLALKLAANNNHTDTVKWLLQQNGKSIKKAEGKDIFEILVDFVRDGNVDMVQNFIQNGQALIRKMSDDCSFELLANAMATNQFSMLRLLIEEGSESLKKQGELGENLDNLLYIANNGRLSIVQWLVLREWGISIDEVTTAEGIELKSVACNGQSAVLDRLLLIGGEQMQAKNYDDYFDIIIARAMQLKAYPGILQIAVYEQALLSNLDDSSSNILKQYAGHKEYFGGNEPLATLYATKLKLIRENNPGMSVLYLPNYRLEDQDITDIASALLTNTVITRVVLDDNYITDNGLAAISKLLKTNKKIVSLTLANNSATVDRKNKNLPLIQAYLLRNQLLAKHAVDLVDIRSIDISKLEASDLAMVLERYSGDKLDFSAKNLISSYNGISQTLRSLQAITLVGAIRVLDLSQNLLKDDDARLLGSYLNDNKNLENINLSHNKIGRLGAQDLLHQANKSSSICSINLSYNMLHVDDKEFKSLESMFPDEENKKNMYNHQRIDVSHNYFKTSCDSLLHNHSIFYSVPANDSSVKISSLLLASESITYHEYLIFLLRRKSGHGGDSEHVKILIEGMYKNGQRFIRAYDFRPNPQINSSKGIVTGVVGDKDFEPDRVEDEKDNYNYICIRAKRCKFERLNANIQNDKDKDLMYSSFGSQSLLCSSGERVYNCLTWAIAKINESVLPVDVHLKEPRFDPFPSHYIKNKKIIVVI